MRILLIHPGADWSVADVWAGYDKALRRAGQEVIAYALSGRIAFADQYLKTVWRKNGKPPDAKPEFGDVLQLACQDIVTRALKFDVDWVLCIAGMYVHDDALVLVRRAGKRVAILFTESPYDDADQLRKAHLADVCFTNERTSVGAFRAVCPNSHYLAQAYDPEVHKPPESVPDAAAHDVVFVGTGWQERCELLGAVDWSGIDLGLYGSWSLLGSRNPLRRFLRGGIIPNGLTTALYQRARIGLNLHRLSADYARHSERIAEAESVNPRVLELAACGAFFISDWRAELQDIFNGAVPSFQTPQELERMIRYYLAYPEECQAAASAIHEAVQGQTFDTRARRMVNLLSLA